MKNPLDLAIVIPTRNSARTLGATLASIRPLCRLGVQLIVSDSSSDDGTLEYARGAGAVIVSTPPGSMYAALNAGMRMTATSWVTYVNSDDLLFADQIIHALGMADGMDIIYGDVDFVDREGRFLHSWRSCSPRIVPRLLPAVMPFPQPGTIVRRCVAERVGWFDLRYRLCADYDLFVRLAHSGARFGYTASVQAAFRVHDGQLSQAQKGAMCREAKQIRRANYSTMQRLLGRAYLQLFRVENTQSYLLRLMRRNQLGGCSWSTL